MEIQYINEHLLPGRIGHLFVILGFVASLLSVVSYFYSVKNQDPQLKDSWKRIGRSAFTVHGLSVFAVIGIIFYIMLNQYYEYQYVWSHVSDDLDFKYIFSAFWEGQEGSFLLWLFWHVVLGGVIMFRSGEWEAPVMAVIGAVQFFILSMIVGLYFYFGDGFIKIGSSPLLLLRDVQEAPIFQDPNYVNLISGNGLNPLLQNYWMTIHPPTLFLGFASTVVPFAYAFAGLWTGKHKEWIKPVLPWALFSAVTLGTGILMGGAWAYEALSFGGYWAWDPVENMSLVPWLVLIAGIHTAVIAKNTGYSIRSSYIFFILTFVLILYSTFLTRSGILGDTSVHAFTEMGLEWQLVIFILTFFMVPIGLYILRRKEIPVIEKEESVYSKEFWMFIGALILIFSSVLISHTTSIPVYSKIGHWLYSLTGFDFLSEAEFWSPPEDVEAHHNKYQIWIAVFMAFLSGTAQFLRYKGSSLSGAMGRKFFRHTGMALAASLILGLLINHFGGFRQWQSGIFLVAAWYVIITNLDYVVSVLKGKVSVAGSAVSHMGFGIMLIGILFSGMKKQIISTDFMSVGLIEGFEDNDNRSNILLRKGLPTKMGDYLVTYIEDERDRRQRTFKVNFKRYDANQQVVEEFNLKPNVLYNKLGTKIEASNPSTKHYFHKDIFTHISALPNREVDPEAAKASEDTLDYVKHKIGMGDTIFTSRNYVVFEDFNREPSHEKYQAVDGDIAVSAILKARNLDSQEVWEAQPLFLIRDSFSLSLDDEIEDLGLKFRFEKIDPEEQKITISVAETEPPEEYVVMQAILFPGINLVWLGSIMMLFGAGMSMMKRYRDNRRLS